MKIPTQDISAFEHIKPQRVIEYLQANGWLETDRFDDKAVILQICKNQDKTYSLLLPLRINLPDYNSRMYEAFKALEVIENRSQAELFNDFLDPNFIAYEKKREIINLRLNSADFNDSNYETSARHLGILLDSIQGLFNSIGQIKSEIPCNNTGKFAQRVLEKTKVSVLGTFKGSFGIRLGLSPQEQLNLFELPELGCEVIEEFITIINLSNLKSFSELSDKLVVLKRRSVQKFRKFLFALLDSKMNIGIEWGSFISGKGGSTVLAYSNLHDIMNFLRQLELSNVETYELIGELIGVNKRSKKFEILTFEDEKITGHIESNLFDEGNNVDLTIGKIYSVRIEEKIMKDASEDERIERKLISVTSYPI